MRLNWIKSGVMYRSNTNRGFYVIEYMEPDGYKVTRNNKLVAIVPGLEKAKRMARKNYNKQKEKK